MKSDIEIAHSIPMLPITQVADTLGIDREYTECYGKYKAKINLDFLKDHSAAGEGRLVLVTAITPTPAGEGKTTTTIGLADALRRIGKKSVVAIREPSLGPVFGIKGGAAGGGYAQVVPMEDINLHFTGDFHAIGAANNLLAAMLDNHIQQGNELGIDPRRIVWKRCVDMNDRQLRHITDGLGGKANGVPREDGFDITVASEVMAVFCMADSLTDLKKRLGSMIVAYRYDDSPVTASMLKAEGAMTALLKDAFMPNLVQTLEGTPAFVHGGPFANIAHGCNSVIATQTALQAADYVITEAGFGADLGAEKFLDIKCRKMGVRPFCVVMVATIRALKMHGGLMLNELAKEDISALKNGMCNLFRHVDNIRNVYGLPCVVAVNRFPGDTENEIKCLLDECGRRGIDACLSEIWEKGGEGGLTLADYVLRYEKKYSAFRFCYEQDDPLEEKLNKLVTRIYHGTTVCYTSSSMKQLAAIKKMGFDKLPVCVAKTQYSFSDDAARRGSPENFSVTVTNLRVSAGAGFIVASMGDIMTMPGLPKHPAAEKIDIDENGIISGLF